MSAALRLVDSWVPLPRDGVPLPPAVAGVVAVDYRMVVHRLGRVGAAVWAWLCSHRDRRGVTVCLAADIQAAVRVSRRYVERVLERLRAVGLVSQAKPVALTPPGTAYADARWRVARTVFGSWCPGGADVCYMPRAAARALAAAPGHGGARSGGKRGGARPGAGRKRGGKGPRDPRDTDAYRRADEALSGTSAAAPLFVRPAKPAPAAKPAKATVVLVPADPTAPSFAPVESPTGTITEATDVAFRWEDHPHLVRGSADARVASAFANAAMLPVPTVPYPPRLPEGIRTGDAVRLLELAYVGAVRQMTGQEVWAFRKSRGKYDTVLATAARLLAERGVAPVAWVAFRLDQWRATASSKGGTLAPPVKWVFREDAVEKHWAWCESAGFGRLGGNRRPTPAALEFMRRVTEQDRALWSIPFMERTVERARQVVADAFPTSDRAVLFQRAQGEAVTAQADLRARAARGEWIW